MRPGRQREEHRAALDRRFRQLQAELAGVLPARADTADSPDRDDATEPGPDNRPALEPEGSTAPGRHAAPRWTLTTAHLRVVAVLLVLGLLATGWWLLRSQPEALPTEVGLTGSSGPAATVEPADPPAADAATADATPSEESDASPAGVEPAGASGQVVVHVAGKVRRPGIVRLPAGSRVVDALDAAGGARPGVALRHVNLARELVDGEQVLVGMPQAAPPPTATGGTAGDSPAPVNLNTADATELETLPGVGPVTAGKILDWRAEHGRFTAVEELLEVDGIGDATLADLAPLVTV